MKTPKKYYFKRDYFEKKFNKQTLSFILKTPSD